MATSPLFSVTRTQLIVGVVASTLLGEGLLMTVLPQALAPWLAALLDALSVATIAGLVTAFLTRALPPAEQLTGKALRRRVRTAYVGAFLLVVATLVLQGERFSPGSLLLIIGATSVSLVLFMEPALDAVVRTLARVERERAEFDRLAMVARRTTNGIVVTDATGGVEWVNEGYVRLTGYTLEDVRGQKAGARTRLRDLGGAQQERDDAARGRMRGAVACGEGFHETLLNRSRDGRLYHIDLDVQPMRDDKGALTGFIGVQTDVHERELALERLRVRATVLEAIHTRASSRTVMEALTRAVSEAHPDMLPSVLLLDQDTLRHGAAAGLPPDYVAAIDGLRIGPGVGSCGTAAWSGEMVITDDIESDERWAAFRGLTRPHGLRSCWSRPFKNRRGAVLGCFALYSKTARGPSAEELALIAEAAELLAIALEQRGIERENELLHAAMESAAEAVVVADAEGRITFRNWALEHLLKSRPVVTLLELMPEALQRGTGRAVAGGHSPGRRVGGTLEPCARGERERARTVVRGEADARAGGPGGFGSAAHDVRRHRDGRAGAAPADRHRRREGQGRSGLGHVDGRRLRSPLHGSAGQPHVAGGSAGAWLHLPERAWHRRPPAHHLRGRRAGFLHGGSLHRPAGGDDLRAAPRRHGDDGRRRL